MYPNMQKLAECKNDHIKLRILSATDPDVVTGYTRAWPDYFVSTQAAPIPFNRLMEPRHTYDSEADWLEGCVEKWCSIPTILVLLPGHKEYGRHAIKSTRGLLFQLGDFSNILLGSVVSLYHTKWVVLAFAKHPHPFVRLAPLAQITF